MAAVWTLLIFGFLRRSPAVRAGVSLVVSGCRTAGGDAAAPHPNGHAG
ncbi:hypothetical protein Ae168Ps1_2166c [Pseudonocardia sp. Ae168_Ps1]|nr:hypothetical protein Ae168Ps1_2166c [Pseudonocardia sp. Ae168_Ps1]